MTYDIPFLIEYLSGFATLNPGDLILIGSPGGSGHCSPVTESTSTSTASAHSPIRSSARTGPDLTATAAPIRVAKSADERGTLVDAACTV
jgi:2-keto-4-pentenoate hydratase/2-oxohepta-3-ene-1,7-dioic acid hydratase in catechol pathway